MLWDKTSFTMFILSITATEAVLTLHTVKLCEKIFTYHGMQYAWTSSETKTCELLTHKILCRKF